MTAPPELCPVCASPVDPGQGHCLECGSRIVASPRSDRIPHAWIWASALLLLVAAGSATGAIVVGRDGAPGGGETVVATSPVVPAPPAPPVAEPPPKAKPSRTSPSPARKPAKLTEWPRRNGYTVVLASIPARGSGLDDARRKASEARNGGVRQVGVLVSSRFASLHPGYYVVFAGVYESLDEAQTASNRLSGRYPNAYARQITH